MRERKAVLTELLSATRRMKWVLHGTGLSLGPSACPGCGVGPGEGRHGQWRSARIAITGPTVRLRRGRLPLGPNTISVLIGLGRRSQYH